MKKLLIICFELIVLWFLVFPDVLYAQMAVDDGVNTSWWCLTWFWKDCFRYERVIWIDNYQKADYTALSVSQDLIYAATSSVWLVLTVIIIYCGLGYIWASHWGKDTTAYKKGLIYAAVWAVLVLWAYAIVRLIQYIAKW